MSDVLRDPGEVISYTPEMMEEYMKCYLDPAYFAENYMYIVSLDYGKIKIPLYEWQRRVLRNMKHDLRYLLKVARQAGKTTVTIAFILWYSIFHEDKYIAVVAHLFNASKEILRRYRESYMMIPKWLQQGVVKFGKEEIELENGTLIVAFATESPNLRGKSVNLLYLDEFALIKKTAADEFIKSVMPVVSSGKTSRVIITSCVTDDTYVYTDKGIKQIGDFVDYERKDIQGGYEIPDYSVCGYRDELNHGSLMHNDGFKETRIIKSKFGELEASLEHKLWACKDGKFDWYRVKELEIGDYVSHKFGMELWGDNDEIDFKSKRTSKRDNYFNIDKITPDFAYFIGLYIAEGWMGGSSGNYHCTITCGDDLSEVMNSLGLRWSCKDGLHYTIGSKSLLETFEYLGFDLSNKAPEKIIPKRLLEMSRENIIAMIQGIMDGDGYAENGSHKRVGIGLSSKKLIDQLRIIFNNFGIPSTYEYCYMKPTKKVKVWSHNHRLVINDYYDVKMYFDKIGFRFDRKQLISETLVEPKRKNNYDYIPFSINKMRELKKEYKIDHSILNFSGEHKSSKHWNRSKMLELKGYLNEYNKDYFENVDNNIRWAEITSIEKSENYVYDFSLNDGDDGEWNHSVIYNGILGHQTPNGYNHFYEMWMQTLPDPHTGEIKSKYRAESVAWDDIPGRDEEWKNEILYGDLKGDISAWEQEYECQFRTSSAGVFNKIPFDETYSRPVERLFDDFLHIYEAERDDKCIYIAGVDMSEGLGKDSCVINVLKYNPTTDMFYQVANYNDNGADPYTVAAVLNYIHTKIFHLNKAFIENNKDFGLINILLGDDYALNDIVTFDSKSKKYGVKTTGQSKPNWVTELMYLFNKEKMILRCLGTQYEFSKFGKNGPKYEGLDGCHDDEVMSILIMMEYVKSKDYMEYKKAGTINLVQNQESRFSFHLDEENSTVNDFAVANVIEKYSTEHNNNTKLKKPKIEKQRKKRSGGYNIEELVDARDKLLNGLYDF